MNMIAYKNILKLQQESQNSRSHVSHANVACQMGHAVTWVWGVTETKFLSDIDPNLINNTFQR